MVVVGVEEGENRDSSSKSLSIESFRILFAAELPLLRLCRTDAGQG